MNTFYGFSNVSPALKNVILQGVLNLFFLISGFLSDEFYRSGLFLFALEGSE